MELSRVMQSKTIRWLLAVCVFLCLFAWLDLFHDLPRKQLLQDSWRTDISVFAHFFITFHCPAQPVGLLVGSAAYLFCARLRGFVRATVPSVWTLTALLVAATVAHLFAVECGCYAFADIVHAAANAILSFVLIGAMGLVFRHGLKMVLALALSLAGGRIVASLVVVPWVFQTDSFFAGGILQCFLVLVGLGCLMALVLAGDCEQQEASKERRTDVSGVSNKPCGLGVHLLMFGFLLAFLHTVGRRIVYGEMLYTSAAVDAAEWGSLPSGVATLLAALIVVAWFFRRQYRFSSVWNMLRTIVFTLAMLELLLLPLLSVSVFAVVLGDCASALYQMLFLLGCYFVYKESGYTASSLFAWGLFLLSAGQAISSVVLEYSIRVVLADSELFAILRVMAFLLCTFATFWIGADDKVRKLWGLRREETAQSYKNAVIQRKCDVIAKEYSLTGREREVLVLVAQGMRANQIAEVLYISLNTVRSHIQRLYAKLAIHSTKELNALVDAVPDET